MCGVRITLSRPNSGEPVGGSLRHDVERRAGQLPGIQRARQVRFVDDRAARRVDEIGGRLHLRENLGIEKTLRLRHQRRVDRNVIGDLQQLREIRRCSTPARAKTSGGT